MQYMDAISQYQPLCEQEAVDKALLLACHKLYGPALLTREVAACHITVSGWVMNPSLDKVLLAHHNLYNCWAWPGGHADGDTDLLQVAVKEVREETGVQHVTVPDGRILSLDVLPVQGHIKNGRYVSAHLHLNATYLLLCEESEALHHRPGENTAVAWFGLDVFNPANFSHRDAVLYNKLIYRAKDWYQQGH